MSDVIVQIYGIRTVEDARMVVGHGAKHIGVSYGHINHTPGQLTCEQAKEIFEGVQSEAVRIGLTCSTDIDERAAGFERQVLVRFGVLHHR